MIGVICTRDILLHPVVTVRCFGWKVFFRSLTARQNQTFLDLLQEADVLPSKPDEVQMLIGRCVGLELQARQIYRSLARTFADDEPVARLFQSMAQQEQGHAELLRVCGAAAANEGWDASHFQPWAAALPELESGLEEQVQFANQTTDRREALQLAVAIESSEINRVFLGVVQSTHSDFVKNLDVFYHTGEKHVAFLHNCVTQLEPSLEPECRAMYDAHLAA